MGKRIGTKQTYAGKFKLNVLNDMKTTGASYSMTANHFEVSDMYRFRLDTPIGYKDDLITSDLCVVTIIGTKDIITMYPVSLSDEFDKEGLATSKELKLKRLQGGIRKW